METLVIIILACIFGFVIYQFTKKKKINKATGNGSTGGSGEGSDSGGGWTPDYPHDLPDGRPDVFRDARDDDKRFE